MISIIANEDKLAMLKNAFFTLAFFGVVVLSTHAYSSIQDNLNLDIFSKKLARINWTKEKDIARFAADWSPFTDDQSGDRGIQGRTILKEQVFPFHPYPMHGSLRKFNETGRHEFAFIAPDPDAAEKSDTSFSKEKANLCPDMIGTLEKKLGKPFKVIDLSDGIFDQEMATSKKDAQWKLKNTDLILNCMNMKVYNGLIPIIILHIAHDDDIADLEDPVFLKCSYTRKYVGILSEKGTSEEAPINLIINPNTKTISSSTHRLGDTTTYDPNKIVTKLDTDKITSVFQFDRTAGNFTLGIRIKKDESTGSDGWGDCQKIPQNQKF